MQARSTALVVDDALPAGFEIETTLGADDAQNGPFKFLGELTNPDVQEAATTATSPRWTSPVRSRSPWPTWRGRVTPGEFFLPGATARDMYRPQPERAVGRRADHRWRREA